MSVEAEVLQAILFLENEDGGAVRSMCCVIRRVLPGN